MTLGIPIHLLLKRETQPRGFLRAQKHKANCFVSQEQVRAQVDKIIGVKVWFSLLPVAQLRGSQKPSGTWQSAANQTPPRLWACPKICLPKDLPTTRVTHKTSPWNSFI